MPVIRSTKREWLMTAQRRVTMYEICWTEEPSSETSDDSVPPAATPHVVWRRFRDFEALALDLAQVRRHNAQSHSCISFPHVGAFLIILAFSLRRRGVLSQPYIWLVVTESERRSACEVWRVLFGLPSFGMYCRLRSLTMRGCSR